MHARLWFLNASAVSISVGLATMIAGHGLQRASAYDAPEIPLQWYMSLAWIGLGVAATVQWWCWLAAHRCTRVRVYTSEAVATNVVLLSFALLSIVVGWATMTSYELPLCPCPDGRFGPSCEPCDCSGHGVCDDGVLGTGECYCDPRYDGIACDACAARAAGYPDCACDRIWTGDRCETCAVGFNCSTDPVTCADGWLQTGADTYPICGACAPNHGGDPLRACTPCAGGDPPCNGRGTCWDNANYEALVWEAGAKDTCTRTFETCDADLDCATSNCRGVCQSLFAPPVGPTQQWADAFSGKSCRADDECNFARTAFDDAGLPDGWWQEGQCTERVCCEEHRYGNATCFDCTDEDGSPSIGRMAPACDRCPGFDPDVDREGQTICNGHGTCLPATGPDGAYESMQCGCQSTWIGADCRCLRGADGLCSACATGFHLPWTPAGPRRTRRRGPGQPRAPPRRGERRGCRLPLTARVLHLRDDITAGADPEARLARGNLRVHDGPRRRPARRHGTRVRAGAPGIFHADGTIQPCPRVLRTGDCRPGVLELHARTDLDEICTKPAAAPTASCHLRRRGPVPVQRIGFPAPAGPGGALRARIQRPLPQNARTHPRINTQPTPSKWTCSCAWPAVTWCSSASTSGSWPSPARPRLRCSPRAS